MLNLKDHKQPEKVILDQLVLFVLSFEGIWFITDQRILLSVAGFSHRGSVELLQQHRCCRDSVTYRTHTGKHTCTLPRLTGMQPHTGVASSWLSVRRES